MCADARSGQPLAHQPVLYHEVLEALRPKAGGRYLDCTVGAGGHAGGTLQASLPDGELLGLDVDPGALQIAEQRLAKFGGRVHLRKGSYGLMSQWLADVGWDLVDGILLDLGVSSMQLDHGDRGFSFKQNAPLGMRFDPEGSLTAEDLVNNLPEAALADILYRYGEEPQSRRLAKAIVKARPLRTTKELADLIAKTLRKKPGVIHPATRSFQALRIAVNRELETLEAALPQAVAALKSGGRLAVIAFHSLEDRIVKQFFRTESKDCICPPEQPVCTCGHTATLKEITRKPIRPQASEISANPRSRSARLRVTEKL
ncbi:MAG: 16S rRNA (cytosine(1402)-N(4))-methyltransferase RsmH [Anaerolineales bacterium]